MTTVAVLADPPVPGFVLSDLVATTPLSAADAADLYAATLADVCVAVERSGAELLVNYRPDEQVPDDVADAERAVRDAVVDALSTPDDVRFEVQVGSTYAGRVGNTVTHLLEAEGVATAAVLDPTAAFVGRSVVDTAAMKLRSSEVVLGPAPGGRAYYAGFAEPIDFDDAFAAPALETLTHRGRDAGLDVDFLESHSPVRTAVDLATAVSTIRARRTAGRPVPARTAAVVESLGLSVEYRDGDPTVVRD